jgi:zona occludens toxin
MLVLVTGQPGNGKTLYTLGLVEQLRQESGRPVYQSGIPELSLPWGELPDATAWPDLPDGSIVCIDECQRVFPPRKQGAASPRHVSEFETHRHRGFDVYLVTQHPQLLDIAVRKLVGRHYHVKRNFGREVATVYQWEECVNPQDRGIEGKALKTDFRFPKDRYAWYKSAEVHTVKKDFPWRKVGLAAGSLLACVGLFVFAFHKLTGKSEARIANGVAAVSSGGPAQAAPARWSVDSFTDRSPKWLWSAPFYDSVAKIQSAPTITGCMEMQVGGRVECKCSNGQGVAQVDELTCHQWMQGWHYDPTKPAENVKEENIRRLDSAGAAQSPTDVQPSRSGVTS